MNIIDIYGGANTPFSSVPIRTYYKKNTVITADLFYKYRFWMQRRNRGVSSIMYYIKPIPQEMPQKTSKKLTE